MTRAIGVAFAGLLACAAGCTSSQVGAWIGDGAPPKTRAELYQHWGLPDAVRRDEGRIWLRYDSAETRGMTLGLRYWAVGLVLERAHRGEDNVWVGIDDANRVVGFVLGRNSTNADYRLWPFGD